MAEIQIRRAVLSDCEKLSRLREALWPESPTEEHKSELKALLIRGHSGTMPLAIFVAEGANQELAGFLEVGLRSHADGCDPSHPVGFVEGWFVVKSHRRRGVGALLLAAAEDWARSQGCIEMASDTWIDNVDSQRVHEALRFEVVDRCMHYKKAL